MYGIKIYNQLPYTIPFDNQPNKKRGKERLLEFAESTLHQVLMMNIQEEI